MLSATPMSVTMPLCRERHKGGLWIDALLADHDIIRQQWHKACNTASPDPMDLLATPLGRDCAGAVQFTPWAEREDNGHHESGFTTLSEVDVEALLLSLRRNSVGWIASRIASASALAGTNHKVGLCYENGIWRLPKGNYPSTHILKPGDSTSPDSAVVEFICQRAASYVGIPSSQTQIVTIGDQRALVVTRYDRVMSADGEYRRIHQEDLCQALGVPASTMHQRDGGPTPESIVALLRKVSSDPDADVRTFWDALIFNWLVDNPSAHARQYSLLLEKTTVRLAPLYGLHSQLPYQESRHPFSIGKTTSAMAFRNSKPFTKIGPPWAWVFAVQSPGLPKKEILERIVDLSRQVPNAIREAAEHLPSDLQGNVTAAKLVEGVQRHAKGRERLAWLWSKLRDAI